MDIANEATDIWRRLDTANREIRLLVLMPSEEFEAPVQCHICKVSLNESPAYEAISYCWGDPKDTAAIELAGAEVQVTRSLHGALRCLRLRDAARTLWADFLCINQNNIDERNEQVQLMARVFGEASEVHVWLGESEATTEMVFQSIRQFADGRGRAILDQLYGNPTTCEDWLRCLLSMYQRPWFERRWVVQEVSVAKHVLFHCGRHTVTGLIMKKCYRELSAFAPDFNACLDGHEGGDQVLIDLYARFAAAVVPSTYGYPPGGIDTFGLAMKFCQYMKCSDPKDKVYSLVGLAHPSIVLNVDYRRDVDEVYRDAIIADINLTKSLDILANIVDPEMESQSSGPSWLPPWLTALSNEVRSNAKEHQAVEFINRSSAIYDAAAGHRAVVGASGKGVLILRGVCHGSIARVGPAWASAGNRLAQFTDRNLSAASPVKAHREEQFARWQAFLGVSDEVAWRVILRDDARINLIGPGQARARLKQEDCDAICHSHREDTILRTATPHTGVQRFNLEVAAVNTKPCITSAGCCGQVPLQTQVGDAVFVLAGSTFPYLLRRVENSTPETYRLIGPCYIHGIMDGEAVAEACKMRGDGKDTTEDLFEVIRLV